MPTVIKGGLDDPFRCVGLARALVRNDMADAILVDAFKKDRKRNGAINRLHDAAQAGLVNFCGLEQEGEDLNFRDAITGRQMQGLGG